MGAKFQPGSILGNAQGSFISAPTVATGAAQNIAHGLPYTPTRVLALPVVGSNGAGAAGVQLPATAITAVAGATNVVVTAPAAFAGGSFIVFAF